MNKRTIILMLAAALSWAACEKEPTIQPNPGENDTTPTVVEKNKFSVDADKQVTLASGNLQFRATTNEWRFAPNAWEALKDANTQASATYDGWIDNFRWASSGYLDSYTYTNYTPYSEGSIDGTEYDWGVHNAIMNGETLDPAGTWRTLSSTEWAYLIDSRSASTISGVENARYALATVEHQVGLILFPDNFEMPAGVAEPSASSINEPVPYGYNLYAASEWNKLQEAGCVFLPAAGCVNPSSNSMVGVDFLGCYWTSTFLGNEGGMNRADQLWFNSNMVEIGSAGLAFPRSVRLAKDIE